MNDQEMLRDTHELADLWITGRVSSSPESARSAMSNIIKSAFLTGQESRQSDIDNLQIRAFKTVDMLEHEHLHPTQKVRLARLLNQAYYNTDTGELEGYEDALNKMIEENSGGC